MNSASVSGVPAAGDARPCGDPLASHDVISKTCAPLLITMRKRVCIVALCAWSFLREDLPARVGSPEMKLQSSYGSAGGHKKFKRCIAARAKDNGSKQTSVLFVTLHASF